MKLSKQMIFVTSLAVLPLPTMVACAKDVEPNKIKLTATNQKFVDSIKTIKKLKAEINSKFLVPEFSKFDNNSMDDNKKYITSINKIYEAISVFNMDTNVRVQEPALNKAYYKVNRVIKQTSDEKKKMFLQKFIIDKDFVEALVFIYADFAKQLKAGRAKFAMADTAAQAPLKDLEDVLNKLETNIEVSDVQAQGAIKAAHKAFNKYFIDIKELDSHHSDAGHDHSDHQGEHNHSPNDSEHTHSHAIYNILDTALHETEEIIEEIEKILVANTKDISWTTEESNALNEFKAELGKFKTLFEVEEKLIHSFIEQKIKAHNNLIQVELEKIITLNNWDKATILVLD